MAMRFAFMQKLQCDLVGANGPGSHQERPSSSDKGPVALSQNSEACDRAAQAFGPAPDGAPVSSARTFSSEPGCASCNALATMTAFCLSPNCAKSPHEPKFDPSVEWTMTYTVSVVTEKVCLMSGMLTLLCFGAAGIGDEVGPKKLQIHKPSLRNSGVSPLNHGRLFYGEHPSYGGSTAKPINDLRMGMAFFHAHILVITKLTVNRHN